MPQTIDHPRLSLILIDERLREPTIGSHNRQQTQADTSRHTGRQYACLWNRWSSFGGELVGRLLELVCQELVSSWLGSDRFCVGCASGRASEKAEERARRGAKRGEDELELRMVRAKDGEGELRLFFLLWKFCMAKRATGRARARPKSTNGFPMHFGSASAVLYGDFRANCASVASFLLPVLLPLFLLLLLLLRLRLPGKGHTCLLQILFVRSSSPGRPKQRRARRPACLPGWPQRDANNSCWPVATARHSGTQLAASATTTTATSGQKRGQARRPSGQI